MPTTPHPADVGRSRSPTPKARPGPGPARAAQAAGREREAGHGERHQPGARDRLEGQARDRRRRRAASSIRRSSTGERYRVPARDVPVVPPGAGPGRTPAPSAVHRPRLAAETGRCLGATGSFRVRSRGADRPPRTSVDRMMAPHPPTRPLGRRSAGHDLHERTAQTCRDPGARCQPAADLRDARTRRSAGTPRRAKSVDRFILALGVSSCDAPRRPADARGQRQGTTTVPVAVVASSGSVEHRGRARPLGGRRTPGDDVHREVHHPRAGAGPDQLGGRPRARRRRGPGPGTARRSRTRTGPRRRR